MLVFLCLSLHQHARAEMRPVPKIRAGVPPFDIIREILVTNRADKQNTPPADNSTAPYITWLADSDARVQAELILANPVAKVFSVRNLGNQLASSLAALDYGIEYLHSPVLLITGNTDSEAVRFFIEGYKDFPQAIGSEIDHLNLPLGDFQRQDSKLSPNEKERMFVEKNVDYQVSMAVERYNERIRKKRLIVVGCVLDVVNSYGLGTNQLFITNINGETDGKKIKKMSLLRTIDKKLLTNVGRPQLKKKKRTIKNTQQTPEKEKVTENYRRNLL